MTFIFYRDSLCYTLWKLNKNYSKFHFNNLVDDEYHQYLYEIMTNGYNRNLKPSKKSSLHHFSDKSYGVLAKDIIRCQIVVKIARFLILNLIII